MSSIMPWRWHPYNRNYYADLPDRSYRVAMAGDWWYAYRKPLGKPWKLLAKKLYLHAAKNICESDANH